jgi:hypothetical protein
MYEVELRVLCIRRNAFAEFSRRMMLPVPPAPGLLIQHDPEDEARSQWLIHVSCLEEGRYLCRLPDDWVDEKSKGTKSGFGYWRSQGWKLLRQGRVVP